MEDYRRNFRNFVVKEVRYKVVFYNIILRFQKGAEEFKRMLMVLERKQLGAFERISG